MNLFICVNIPIWILSSCIFVWQILTPLWWRCWNHDPNSPPFLPPYPLRPCDFFCFVLFFAIVPIKRWILFLSVLNALVLWVMWANKISRKWCCSNKNLHILVFLCLYHENIPSWAYCVIRPMRQNSVLLSQPRPPPCKGPSLEEPAQLTSRISAHRRMSSAELAKQGSDQDFPTDPYLCKDTKWLL